MSTSQDQVNRLKRDLRLTKDKYEDLVVELESKERQLLQMEDERNRYRQEMGTIRGTLMQTEKIINQRVEQKIDTEKDQMRRMEQRIAFLENELQSRDNQVNLLKEELERKDAEVEACEQKLREVVSGYDMTEAMKDIKEYRDDKLQAQRTIQGLTQELNRMSDQMEDLMAENSYLRELAQVPDNYGIIQDIKLTAKQKNEDYMRLIRELEDEREDREREIAELRQKNLRMTTLYNRVGSHERYRGLTIEQLNLLDQFVLNLKEGREEYPLNDRSRELRQENERLKAQLEFLEGRHMENLDNLIKRFSAMPVNRSSKIGGQIELPNKELGEPSDDLYAKLEALIDNLSQKNVQFDDRKATGVQQPAHTIQWPPVPLSGPYGNWSDIKEGYSYRFKSKLPVISGDLFGEQGFDQNMAIYEIASLQLQNLETMELMERKDRELQSLNMEIEEFRNQMRQSLLVQDELFKQYFEEKGKFEEKIKGLTNENFDLKDRNAEIEHKAKLLEDLVVTLRKSDETELKATLAEYAKKISIQEVNLIRLARKYDCLKSDEKNLRESYHKIEAAHAEKEGQLMKRLSDLMAWKQKATSQLKVLFGLQVDSVPIQDHRLIRSQLEILQEKYSDLRIKEADLLKRVAKLETNERDLFMKNELVRDLKEEILEGELELEMLRKRLEELDPTFKKYQMIFRQIVDVIKKKNISPTQVFEMMDTNKDGKIAKREFEIALNSMHIPVTRTELDILFMFMDLDGSDIIEYKEFIKKLKRSGVKMRNNEEELVFKVYEAITKANLTLKQAFDIFDKDGDNLISKKDMTDTFAAMNFGLDTRVIEGFYAMADINGDGSINFDEFYRLFETTIKEAFREERKGQVDELNWKMQVMLKMDNAIKKSGITLLDAFKIIDRDTTGKVSYEEFKGLFEGMKVEIASSELLGLFNEIDKDKSGEITYFEFQHYFNEAKRENDRINRLKFITSKTENLRESAMKSYHDMDEVGSHTNVLSDAHKLSMKISLLETREKNANNRVESLNIKIKNLDEELKHYEKQIKDLESHNLKLQEEYYNTREREIKLEHKVQGAIPRELADKLKKVNEKMALDWADLQASRKTFKNLYEYSVSQVKILKLSIEKRKNEGEVLQATVKDLQMTTDENALVGKLQHELMVSKWNEGVVNKKYESILDDNRQIRLEIEEVEVELHDREAEIVSIHNAYSEKVNILERTLTDTKLKILPTISLAKIEELGNKIREIQYQKSDLETYNRTLREELHTVGVRKDYLETQKNAIEELEARLKKSHTDELSQQIIEVSTKLSDYKLAELKAKRDVNLLEQKEDYHQRLIRQQTERMKLLEEELAAWELKHAQREDFWRKRYNDQMGMIFGKPEDGAEGTTQIGVLSKEPRKTTARKDVAYLAEVATKNDELRSLKHKVEEYEKLLEDKNVRIKVLEESMTKLDQRSKDVAEPRMEATKSLIKEAYNEEEAKKFAHAAQKTIQTLHDIIEDKNKQLHRKDEMLKKLREESLAHKNTDVGEIHRLNQIVEEMNREAANGRPQHVPTRSMVDSAMLGRVSANEVEAIMLEKDRRMELFSKEVEGHRREKQELSDKLREYRIKCEHLQSELTVEKTKNEAGKLQKEIESLKKTIKIKDQELNALKKSIEAVKEEYLKINGMTVEKEEEMKNKLKEKSNQQEIQMKLATQRIQELDSKMKKHEKELKEFHSKEAESREKMTLLKEENQKLRAEMSEKDAALKKEKQQRSELTIERDTLKEQKEKAEKVSNSRAESEKEDLLKRVSYLEKANDSLRAEKAKEFFDEDGNLKEGDYLVFPDAKTLNNKVKDWMQLNPQPNLLNEFQAFDKNKSGYIRENDVYAALKAIGVKLKSRDQATLMQQAVKRENNEVNYADLYSKLRGCQDFGQSYCSDKVQGKPLNENENKFGALSKQKKEVAFGADKDKLPASTQKSIDILKNEISNLKKENEKLEKQLHNWKENYNKLDREHKNLLSKPITKAQGEAEGGKKISTLQKLDTVQELRDRVYDLENKVNALEKILNTEKEPLIQKLKQNKDKLEEEIKQLKAEALKSRSQVENFYSKKLTPDQLKEEMIYEKDMIITNLKDKLDDLRSRENALQDRLFTLEQKNLELHLEKESHDLQIQRLNRRIHELDEFKSTYQELIKNADKAMSIGAKRRT